MKFRLHSLRFSYCHFADNFIEVLVPIGKKLSIPFLEACLEAYFSPEKFLMPGPDYKANAYEPSKQPSCG